MGYLLLHVFIKYSICFCRKKKTSSKLGGEGDELAEAEGRQNA